MWRAGRAGDLPPEGLRGRHAGAGKAKRLTFPVHSLPRSVRFELESLRLVTCLVPASSPWLPLTVLPSVTALRKSHYG